jgi:hypothetical protein
MLDTFFNTFNNYAQASIFILALMQRLDYLKMAQGTVK